MNPITKNPAIETNADLVKVFHLIFSIAIIMTLIYGLICPQKRLMCFAWVYIFLILGPNVNKAQTTYNTQRNK